MRTRVALASSAAAIAAVLVLGTGSAAAQGTAATGLGVGVQAMLPGVGIDIGTPPVVLGTIPPLAGPAITYQTPMFHIDGIVMYYGDGITVLGAGGRFWYRLHSTQASDFSVGGGLGFINIDPDPGDSTTEVDIEAGAKLRAFLTPSVALSASAGIGILSGDLDFVHLGAQLVGTFGVTYFFF